MCVCVWFLPMHHCVMSAGSANEHQQRWSIKVNFSSRLQCLISSLNVTSNDQLSPLAAPVIRLDFHWSGRVYWLHLMGFSAQITSFWWITSDILAKFSQLVNLKAVVILNLVPCFSMNYYIKNHRVGFQIRVKSPGNIDNFWLEC